MTQDTPKEPQKVQEPTQVAIEQKTPLDQSIIDQSPKHIEPTTALALEKDAVVRPKRRGPPRRQRSSPSNSRTSAATIRKREKIKEALDYRKQGYSYAQIAEAMKIHVPDAYKYVKEGIDMIPKEAAEAVLMMELDRLDQMQAAIYDAAAHGDLEAQAAVHRIMERRARYLGLEKKDTAAQLDVQIPGRIIINFVDAVAAPDEPKMIDVTPTEVKKE